MKLMKAMTAAAKSNNFTIHNVVPDGNCMFAAVVDQLEINGVFSFSSKSLRQACVEHLRSNPESEDGTHYEMFMDNESWTQYLDRMSLEGQWGDHLMLQAVSQVRMRYLDSRHKNLILRPAWSKLRPRKAMYGVLCCLHSSRNVIIFCMREVCLQYCCIKTPVMSLNFH